MSQAIMVGDSETDVATARAAGVPIVAVTFGYTTIPIVDLAPDRIIDDFADLWDAVASIRADGARQSA
jgi:phosphoglycolate phosphatase